MKTAALEEGDSWLSLLKASALAAAPADLIKCLVNQRLTEWIIHYRIRTVRLACAAVQGAGCR